MWNLIDRLGSQPQSYHRAPGNGTSWADSLYSPKCHCWNWNLQKLLALRDGVFGECVTELQGCVSSWMHWCLCKRDPRELSLFSTRWKTDRKEDRPPFASLRWASPEHSPSQLHELWLPDSRTEKITSVLEASHSSHVILSSQTEQSRTARVPLSGRQSRQKGFHSSSQLGWNCLLCNHRARGSFSVLLAPT